MAFIAVVDTDVDGWVVKFAEYETLPEAEAQVSRVAAQFPAAFAAPDPGGGWAAWKVAGGVLGNAGPRPEPAVDLDEVYDDVIRNSLVIKAVVLALNDGSFVPGAGHTGPELKTIIKAKM